MSDVIEPAGGGKTGAERPEPAILPSGGRLPPRAQAAFDRILAVQRPLVLAHIRQIRTRRPDASPAQVIAILERRYLAATTTGGAAVGASSAVPAIGTGASIALSGVETVGFLETSALFAQSITEVHGIAVLDPDRARALVMTMILGSDGQELVRQFAAQAAGTGATRSAYWGELVTRRLPGPVVRQIADRLRRTFVKRFAAHQGGSVIGRLIPFGIGAVIGGAGNHLLARQVVRSARTAFPPPPATFPAALDPRPRPRRPRPALPKLPRRPRAE
ncbi:MAG: hypothetical protein J0G30_07665 [Actinomycetales bacterium]|nr:hypothetical protein [Actinomycetales bacterium]